MNTTRFPARVILISGIAAGVIAASWPAMAGLQIPYTNDVNTIHLWHFDGATNTTITTDEILTGSITLTNEAQTNVPGATSALGAPGAFPALNTAFHIIPTNLTTGNCLAFAYGGTNAITNFVNPTTGAFTFEALVNFEGNPALNPSSVNMEIISGDGNVNGNNNRGWQFRVQSGAVPALDFNAFPGNNAGVNNIVANIPLSGPDALTASNWYHAAVTYTGNAPTNGDPAGVLTLYWTLLDPSRTNASVLLQTNVQAGFGMATTNGTAQLGIGGNGRNFPGTIANNEGLKGVVDEVRLSIVARKSNEMAFTTGGSLTRPTILSQPPANTFIGFGQTLTLATLVSGSPAPVFFWSQNGTNVPGQTNSTLIISSVDFTNAGAWRLTASNSVGTTNSIIANVSVGAAFSELFNTGIDTNGNLSAPNVADPHYVLTHSADVNNLGPNTVDWDMTIGPIASAGGTFANADGVSEWIGPQANNYTSPNGQYIYRTTFLLDSVDLTQPVTLSGLWFVNAAGTNILLNGVPTGISHPNVGAPQQSANFTITNGFVPGLNTLDFMTTRNTGASESAVRVQISGIGQALPAGKPVLLSNPVSKTVHTGQNSVSFAVVARGRPPLTYQWWADGSPLGGATNRVLSFSNAFTGGQGSSFFCVVSNASGATNSTTATLSFVGTNQTLIVPNYTNTIYTNGTLDIDISVIYQACVDPDNDSIFFFMADTSSTNAGSIVQNNTILTYTPPVGFLGTDGFTATFGENGGSLVPSHLVVNVVPRLSPTVTSTSAVGTNFVFSGSGGATNGGYTVLSSTSITAPLTNWTVIGAGSFDGSGNFSFTNGISPAPSQRYYILRIP